jgi:hypothetical protein
LNGFFNLFLCIFCSYGIIHSVNSFGIHVKIEIKVHQLGGMERKWKVIDCGFLLLIVGFWEFFKEALLLICRNLLAILNLEKLSQKTKLKSFLKPKI